MAKHKRKQRGVKSASDAKLAACANQVSKELHKTPAKAAAAAKATGLTTREMALATCALKLGIMPHVRYDRANRSARRARAK